MPENYVISFWPKKHDHFGPKIIPYNMPELHRYCSLLDIAVFPGDNQPTAAILENAFHHWNYVDQEFQASDAINARAKILQCHVSATAGDMFSVSDDKNTEWWYCDNIGWLKIEMK